MVLATDYQYMRPSALNPIDIRLSEEGKLGVAVSRDILQANIERMVNNWDDYFSSASLDDVLADSRKGPGFHSMSYLPKSGKEVVEVTIRGTGTPEQMMERAKRNLAYKILHRKATSGVNYELEVGEDYITMKATPIVLTASH